MKINMLTLTLFGFLSLGLKTAAGAQDTLVDKSVNYGEKYLCQIKTADEKTYSLNIEWTAEPDKFSKIPKWKETLKYQLFENLQQIDSGSFSDQGFGYNKIALTFAYDKYVMTGDSSFATRVGTNTSNVHIEIKKGYDQEAKEVLSVASFTATHTFDKFYGTVNSKQINLTIVSSECAVEAANKQ